MAFGSEWQGVGHFPLSGEARCSQAPASEASDESAAPASHAASGEPAACAHVLLLRPLLGFLGFLVDAPLRAQSDLRFGFGVVATGGRDSHLKLLRGVVV